MFLATKFFKVICYTAVQDQKSLGSIYLGSHRNTPSLGIPTLLVQNTQTVTPGRSGLSGSAVCTTSGRSSVQCPALPPASRRLGAVACQTHPRTVWQQDTAIMYPKKGLHIFAHIKCVLSTEMCSYLELVIMIPFLCCYHGFLFAHSK